MENNVYDEQENCNRGIGSFQNTHDAGLDEGVFHVKQVLAEQTSPCFDPLSTGLGHKQFLTYLLLSCVDCSWPAETL